MSGLESLVQSYFLGFEVNKDEFSGYIDGSEEFIRFRDDLRAIGFMFVIRTTAAGSSFLFNHTRKGAKTQVPFFGPLFQITKNLSYECRFGKNRNHASKHSLDVSEPKKKRSSLPSKKIGCKATMHVSELTIYPEFTITEYNSHGSIKQTEVRRKLNEALAAGRKSPQQSRQPTTVIRYVIALSRESLHSHSLAIADACQSLHPKLAAEIKRIAFDENVTVPMVRLHLETFVQSMIDENKCITPNRQNRCYYPTNKVIYQHLYSAVAIRKKNSEDRMVLEKYVESLSFRRREMDQRNDSDLSIDDKITPDPTVSVDSFENREISKEGNVSVIKPFANPLVKPNSVQLVKVKIMTPDLLSTKAPNKSKVPKLKVLSDEAERKCDLSTLRSEIWELLEQSHDIVLLTEDVDRLEAAKAHLVAARQALTSEPVKKTVSVFLRSSRRKEAHRVKPVVIRKNLDLMTGNAIRGV